MRPVISHFISCVAMLSLMASAPVVRADDYKVATIDARRIIREAKQSKAKVLELEATSKAKQKEFDVKNSALKATEQQLITKNASADSPEVQDLRQKARDFARQVKDTQDDLQAQYVKTSKAVMKDALKVIESYSKAHSISLVLDKPQDKESASPVLFSDSSADITNDVLKELNKG